LADVRVHRGEPYCRPKRTVRRCQNWLRFPVVGVSWEDAKAYAAWLANGRVPGARTCSEREWERAARGADGRLFPEGNAMHPGDAAYGPTYATDAEQNGVDEVESFPVDRSPFGVFDLAGNVMEWVGVEFDPTRASRGGYSMESEVFSRAALRWVLLETRRDDHGIRICADAP
jgi:formylglycine-generating enzyme required for sulfatase activity